MQPPQPGLRSTGLLIILFCLLLPGLAAGCSGGNDLSFPTEYQAVFLDNGAVLFGKIGEAGSGYLTLRDVYFVQRQVDQDKKEAKNLLMKRGGEWHGPDFMRINTRHVVFIEPVAPDSRVAQLIRETKAAPPVAAPMPPAAPSPPATPESAQPGKPPAAAPPAGTPPRRRQ